MIAATSVDRKLEIDPGVLFQPANTTRLQAERRWPGLTVEVTEGGNLDVSQAKGCLTLIMVVADDRSAQSCSSDPCDALLPVETCDVALLAGGSGLDLTWQASERLMLVTVDPDLLVSVSREVFGLNTAHVTFETRSSLRDSLLCPIMAGLYREYRSITPDEHYAAALGRALAAHLIHVYATTRIGRQQHVGGMAPRRLRRVVDHVELHLDKPLCLTRLADVAGMSPWHFSRVFKQATGKTPHRYVMARRVLRAKRLLAEEDLPILDIALAVGCVDHSHLTRVFRRATGITPSAYRSTLTSMCADPPAQQNGNSIPSLPSRS